ncbi:MAG: hypothetical protein ACRECF_07340 [Methyloceanibacter sp.]
MAANPTMDMPWVAKGSLVQQDMKLGLYIADCDLTDQGDQNAEFIATAFTNCRTVNPDNPMAVADNIEQAFELLERAVRAAPIALAKKISTLLDRVEP